MLQKDNDFLLLIIVKQINFIVLTLITSKLILILKRIEFYFKM